ncbi:MAG TPA: hypothetical protein VHD62_05725 [Opitutaceae bacterium]|nr:hypothetical protein [Opitutaceae bacterium]
MHLAPLVAVQVVSVLCGLIGVRWSSAVVPPAALGLYGLLLSAQQLATAVTHQGYIKHVQQCWTPQTPARVYLRRIFSAGHTPLAWLAAGLALAVLYFRFSAGLDAPLGWWAWLLAANLLAVVSAAAQAALQAEERYWTGFGVAAVGAATRSFLPPLLVMLGGAALPRLGAGFLLHAALFAVVAVWCLRPAWRRGPGDAPAIASPAAVVRAFMGAGLFAWLGSAAPRWLAAEALDAENTGYFILATNLAMVVPASAGLIAQNYSFPALFAAGRRGAGARELLRFTERVVGVVLLVTLAGLAALAIVTPRLIGIVIDARYASAAGWIMAAGGGIAATLSAPLFCNLLIARDHARACFRLNAISAAFRCVLLAGLVFFGGRAAFRLGLVFLPWPTVALEWWLTRRWAAERP